jgi:rod shape-determining protein MreC
MNLRDENEILAKENRDLKLKLGMKNLLKDPSYKISTDSTIIKKYNFIVAKVINNSTDKFHNYLTINKGWNDSITPGMGVICPTGVVGKVKSCSKYFATITSLLHKDMLISSKIKSSNAIGTTHWEGMDPTKAMLMYIPRHIKVNKGDVVLASEFNSVFPEGEMIGKVSDIKIMGDDNFYKLDIKLATDFSTLNYVYVIRNRLKFQQDSLETMNIGDNESK